MTGRDISSMIIFHLRLALHKKFKDDPNKDCLIMFILFQYVVFEILLERLKHFFSNPPNHLCIIMFTGTFVNKGL
jgi:hypothetical protein